LSKYCNFGWLQPQTEASPTGAAFGHAMQALGTDEAEGSWLGQMQAESPGS